VAPGPICGAMAEEKWSLRQHHERFADDKEHMKHLMEGIEKTLSSIVYNIRMINLLLYVAIPIVFAMGMYVINYAIHLSFPASLLVNVLLLSLACFIYVVLPSRIYATLIDDANVEMVEERNLQIGGELADTVFVSFLAPTLIYPLAVDKKDIENLGGVLDKEKKSICDRILIPSSTAKNIIGYTLAEEVVVQCLFNLIDRRLQ
jgi:hypothetical protein